MDLTQRLQNVAVLGAAGKMGSGISLLLAHELARTQLTPMGESRLFRLALIDRSEAALAGLLRYLRVQLTKRAEKSIGTLRGLYAKRHDLVENGEMIDAFVAGAMDLLRPSVAMSGIAGATLVFEAVFEDEALKTDLLRRARESADVDAWYFTNTSSIPIAGLADRVGIQGRIVGYHFYNPPAVQQLLELITTEETRPAVKQAAEELAKRLGKTVFPANDVAGFIGNGHFMRDALHAIAAADRLRQGAAWAEALYKINLVSQQWLIRPMGIFQLIDYVGIEVVQMILRVMDAHLPGQGLHSSLVDDLVQADVLGGQNYDGTQKDGIFQYHEGTTPAAVYEPSRGTYIPLDQLSTAAQELGSPPEESPTWREGVAAPNRTERIDQHFAAVRASTSQGSRLALDYLAASNAIGKQLVTDGVALNAEDVNGVLTHGFFHLYGPINGYAGEQEDG